MSENYKFVQNTKCEYFPCHECKNTAEFNCLFCYCPLYMLGNKCGGNFSYTENGIKNCADCTLPHSKGGYDHVMSKMGLVMEKGKKRD
ncbi:cysteine-rich small domain-containing protein [Marinifilum sp.]|uniref:cysteine-rich small domain-containing protein n=1 Tax=Marinifilum sp. TaxID=2033137 RepID=UPI003BABBC80